MTKCIVESEGRLLTTLSEISEDDDATVKLCTEASGLLIQIERHNFFQIGKFLAWVLGVLKPTNAISQPQSMDMSTACQVVSTSPETSVKMNAGPNFIRHLLRMFHILQGGGEH